MTKHDEAFRALLNYKFIFLKEHRVDEVADKMGVSPITFYKYMNGQMNFPVGLMAKLYKATGDIEFLNFILKDTDQMLTPREQPKAKKDITGETLDVMVAAGRFAEDVRKAQQDGRLTEMEKKRLNNRIDEAHKELEDARMVVNHD